MLTLILIVMTDYDGDKDDLVIVNMFSVQEYRFRPASSDLLPVLITNSPTFFPRWFHFQNNSLLKIMQFSTQLFRGISKRLSTGCQAWQVHKLLLLYSIRDPIKVLFVFFANILKVILARDSGPKCLAAQTLIGRIFTGITGRPNSPRLPWCWWWWWWWWWWLWWSWFNLSFSFLCNSPSHMFHTNDRWWWKIYTNNIIFLDEAPLVVEN